jgi:hypothetical protein
MDLVSDFEQKKGCCQSAVMGGVLRPAAQSRGLAFGPPSSPEYQEGQFVVLARSVQAVDGLPRSAPPSRVRETPDVSAGRRIASWPASGAVRAQQLRNPAPHRTVDYGRMLARMADALVTDLTQIDGVSQQRIKRPA